MSLLAGLMPSSLGNVGLINNLLTTIGVGITTLPAFMQNGNSSLGLLPVPVLPAFLGGPDSYSSEFPWGNRTANGTDYYTDIPDTGVTRYYELHIARTVIAPDGIEKRALLVNGQFPGPTLEANWGDWFEIVVHNEITEPEEGTSLHWHGLTMKHTQSQDGVPGVSQCPIAPGKSMTYRFQADLYGTGWYHSHFSAQMSDGLYGPLIVYGPKNLDYDIDLGPIIATDYYHQEHHQVTERVMSSDLRTAATTFSDSTLIQGKMKYDCAMAPEGSKCDEGAGIAKFQFTPGKSHRLRFINPSSFAVTLISIDEHDMTVIANDFVEVVPYTTKLLILASGQRMDVIVRAKTAAQMGRGAYWLRVRQPTMCALAFQPFALAAIYYEGTDTNATPLSLPQPDFLAPRLLNCANDDLGVTEPFYAIQPKEPDVTVRIAVTQFINATGHTLYIMNGKTFRANFNEPALRYAQAGNLSYLEEQPDKNIYDFGRNESIRIVFQNYLPFAHPMHLHGQNMFILNEGVGTWDWKTVINPHNPLRRDTHLLQPNGYLAVQLESDNPGVWPFHCHFTPHASQGLMINVVQRPDDIEALTNIPGEMDPVCRDWQEWTDSHVVHQIDSGVKLRRPKE